MTFKCGHPKTRENTQGVVSPRCKTCAHIRDEQRKSQRARLINGEWHREQDKNRSVIYRPSKLKNEPAVMGEDPTGRIAKGTVKLRDAIYQHHPYVFWQARVDGRYCVMPGEDL